jgi:hypothetical protein
MAGRSRQALELNDDPDFQERWWTAQRWGWAGFGVIVVIGLLGLTGAGGWLSSATVRGQAGAIDYPLITRWQSDDDMAASFAPADAAVRELRLARTFLEQFQITDIEPAPAQSIADADGMRLRFDVQPGNAAEIVVHLRAEHPGYASYVFYLDGEALPASTFVLP